MTTTAVVERCAGIDVGKKFVLVCILTGVAQDEPQSQVRRYGTTVPELEQLRHWLAENGCTQVVMESTGSYWIPLFNLLEDALEVVLANPQQVKNLRGHKTDVQDCRWLAHLLRHGMIRASFIPPRPIRELRDLTRRRRQLIHESTRQRNRISKVLETANVKLGSVLTDLFGASGVAMLLALLENRRGPEQIARLARGAARSKIPQIAGTLRNHRLTDHHRFLVRQGLLHLQFLEEQIADLDHAISLRTGSQYGQTMELLQSLPGISQDAAACIVAETGADMRSFPTAAQLCSWAGVCPGNNESAGIHKSGQTTRGNRWLRATLCQAAWAASRKLHSCTQTRFQHLAPRIGRKRAVVAVAHLLLLLVHRVLTTGQPFQPASRRGLAPLHRRRCIRHHLRCLQRLGVEIDSKFLYQAG